MLNTELAQIQSRISRRWWIPLVVGFLWLIVGVIVLRFDVSSVATIGLMLGAVFLLAALYQFGMAGIQGGGWAVLRIILGVLFIGGAIWSFVSPYNAFWSLAAAFGFLLILNGGFDIAYSAMAQPVNPTWWLGLVVGILEVALGFWASQQYIGARATLLVLWVGFFAIFRGISDLVIAFELHAAGQRAT
ncbi:MAG TPA: DUF308 domain-containing protein [Acidimicrobiales bacterium]|jgi:uncharacterized membrane protein HdeD (DUF308 family)|nr:DUF308 domain-containing protein [Acidimicrobiales bacterium]